MEKLCVILMKGADKESNPYGECLGYRKSADAWAS